MNLDFLKNDFPKIEFRQKRPDIIKLLIPFFHEDGDMVDLFIKKNGSGYILSDFGLSLMRLSYNFDIDTPNKEKILTDIVTRNRCEYDDGEIYIKASHEQLVGAIYQFIQTVTKVTSMDILSKEYIKSYFFDLLDEFIFSTFGNLNVKSKYLPLKEEHDLVVDYMFPAKKPIYLFGINDNSKASKVVITSLNLINKQHNFRSLVVHEDFNSLSNFNRTQITNACDKQFTNLNDFKNNSEQYFQRELLA